MKKLILLLLLTLFMLSACQDPGKEMTNPDARYTYIIDMIKEHEVFSDTSNYLI